MNNKHVYIFSTHFLSSVHWTEEQNTFSKSENLSLIDTFENHEANDDT